MLNMNAMLEESETRPRDPVAERREREGYQILERIYRMAGGRPGVAVEGMRVATELDLSRERAFRGIQYLTLRDYLDYMGAGPQVALTRKGAHYLEQGARLRKSVR